MACPSVIAKIAEIRRCIAEGKAWCTCVEGDLAKAEEKLAAGNCSSARYHAIEALKRCTGSKYDLGGGEDSGGGEFSFNPLPSMEL